MVGKNYLAKEMHLLSNLIFIESLYHKALHQ